MATDREHGAETNGAHGAGGEPGVPPNVYHPHAAPTPSYEEYTDPAAAHGWQNAYDETRELPPVPALDDPAGPPPLIPGGGRADLRRRRKQGGRRRVAVAGVLGAAGVVAVIAGLTGGSGSPAGQQPAKGGRVSSDDSATTRKGSGTPSATDTAGSPGGTSPSPTPTSTASSARTATSPAAQTSAAPTPTTAPPSATATTTAPSGRGHGRGTGKKPRWSQDSQG
ncbi:hypothetical protein [Streptomyces sp. NPDC101165]|uniref:hypothetical protein n=1 Tax=Streptomyces sp. NPDC101165 TaxID=3366119 RepID=UPI0037F64137